VRVLETTNTPTLTLTTGCNACDAKLEVEKGDKFREVPDQRDGNAVVFVCANCGADIWVAKTLVPKDWFVSTRV